MKKIMFNDKYGLTKAVLDGRKTMTRRIINEIPVGDVADISDWGLTDGGKACIALYEGGRHTTDIFPTYQPGEIVAVAQRYSELSWDSSFYEMLKKECVLLPQYELKGWDNKMFVKADYMPHRIYITDIKVERLQDISCVDCYEEGIMQSFDAFYYLKDQHFNTPKEAFADLIDKVSGKGTWASNPYVFVYEFKLI